MSGFNLEARWIPFAERVPVPSPMALRCMSRAHPWSRSAVKIVLARKILGNNVEPIYVEYDEYCTDPPRVFSGLFYMRMDELHGWEWLEVKEKGGE